MPTPKFSRLIPIGDLRAHFWAQDTGHAPEKTVLNIAASNGFAVTLHLTAEECEALGTALNDAADWMRAAPVRAAEALAQEERDNTDSWERPESCTRGTERGEFDAAAMRTVREGAVA